MTNDPFRPEYLGAFPIYKNYLVRFFDEQERPLIYYVVNAIDENMAYVVSNRCLKHSNDSFSRFIYKRVCTHEVTLFKDEELEDLLPTIPRCLHCYGEAVVHTKVTELYDKFEWFVMCKRCGICTPPCETQEHAIMIWAMRT